MRHLVKPLIVLALVTGSGCTGVGGALRDDAHRNAPLVARSDTAHRDPGRHVLVVNPGHCLIGYGWPGVLISLGCLCVVVPLDLVALPFTLSHRFQDREVLRLQASCGVEDPATLVANDLAGTMTRDFGFAPPGNAPQDAVVLEVRTLAFRVSPRAAWKGTIELSAAGERGYPWHDTCYVEAPARGTSPEDECEAVRGEIPQLVDHCVESFARNLSKAWTVPMHPRRATATATRIAEAQDPDGSSLRPYSTVRR